MSARTICALVVMGLALVAAPTYAEQATQPAHHQRGAMMGAGHESVMGAGGGSMMGAGGMPMMGACGQMMGVMSMMGAMAGHVEGRLAFLKTELEITDAQLPQWDKFAAALRDNSKAMEAMMPGGTAGTAGSATLPDRLAMREKMMAAHLDALRKLTNAVTPLYAAFSVEQKKTADDLIAPMGMMM